MKARVQTILDVSDGCHYRFLDGMITPERPGDTRAAVIAAAAEMNFPINYLLADLCRHITLLPGDIVLTGTPANSRPMQPGDVVEVEVTGVGQLSNTVVAAPKPSHHVGHQPTDSEGVRRVALGQFPPRERG